MARELCNICQCSLTNDRSGGAAIRYFCPNIYFIQSADHQCEKSWEKTQEAASRKCSGGHRFWPVHCTARNYQSIRSATQSVIYLTLAKINLARVSGDARHSKLLCLTFDSVHFVTITISVRVMHQVQFLTIVGIRHRALTKNTERIAQMFVNRTHGQNSHYGVYVAVAYADSVNT